VPRNRVLKDEVLLEIASNPPDSPEALERIRSVPKGFAASRLGKSLLDAVVEGKDAAPPEVTEPERKRRKREPSPAAVDLLKTLLRLRAEMKVPGRAWLQFEITPAAGGTEIRQTALFDASGLFGLVYWYALYPLHRFVFGGMLRGIADSARRTWAAR